jgi:tRNA U55 pseudouridine synthase TruB
MNYDDEITALADENNHYVEAVILLLLLLKQKQQSGSISKKDTDKILKEIESKTKDIKSFNHSWADRMIKISVTNGVSYALDNLDIDIPDAKISINISNKALINAAIEELQNNLDNVGDNIQKRARQSVREILSENMRKQTLEKRQDGLDSAKNTKTQLKALYGDKVDNVITDSMGRNWKMDQYINMIANTSLMNAQNDASINEGINRGYTLGQITLAPNTKDACRFHQGRIVKLDDSIDAPYPSVQELKNSGQIFHQMGGF